ncbi:hypothetical protein KGQ25_02170 [Patescibacteria group bacterium]|nr:hypothetical protein [Patescibacteria group bacterium]MDE2021477.1 hypothetical protein [Patescibacteria group bacterium]MDE2173617.1 hypothetical protein [Patescibacteria group bacterium]
MKITGENSAAGRIVGAIFVSAVLVVGAYFFARSVESPKVAEASTETALLQAIATKDSNGDGLPDWEKTLYGIPVNSTTTDYFHLGMTDGEAVARGLIVPKAIADIPAVSSPSATSTASDSGLPPPPADGTITAAFARNFFMLYLAAKQTSGGAPLSQADMMNIAQEALTQLTQTITAAPDFKSMQDLTVSGSGSDALKAFAAKAEAVFLKNTSNATTSEINYLRYAIEGNDAAALLHMASIAKAYRDAAAGLAVLPVPQELAAADLALINALARSSGIINDFTRVNTDPLATILAIKQYAQAVLSLQAAFVDIGKTYQATGVSLSAGTPGASFVNLITDIGVNQQTGTQKP